MSNYQAFETLREHKARLHGSVLLGTGVELAARSNCNDRVTQESADHHTLSLYVADGYECYQQVPGGWRNGGGPDRFCIMPRQYASTGCAQRSVVRAPVLHRRAFAAAGGADTIAARRRST